MRILFRIVQIGWLLIAVLSTGIALYVIFTEGFMKGKAWALLLLSGIAAFLYFYRSKNNSAAS